MNIFIIITWSIISAFAGSVIAKGDLLKSIILGQLFYWPVAIAYIIINNH